MAKSTKFLSWLVAPHLIGCWLAIAIALFVAHYYKVTQDPRLQTNIPWYIDTLSRLHNLTIDMRLRFRGERSGTPDVAVLTIDEKALSKYGRWPWSRSMVANVVDKAIKYGANTISFDIIFSEPQDDILESLTTIEASLAQALPDRQKQLQGIFAREKALNDHDRLLSETIAEHQDKLVLGAVYEEFDLSEGRPPDSVDYCMLAIDQKEGFFDYWDKEGIVVGATDTLEVQFPAEWQKRIVQHLNWLDFKVADQWLNQPSPLQEYFDQHGISFSEKNVIALVTYLIRYERQKFTKALGQFPSSQQSLLSWAQLDPLLPKSLRVELAAKMRVENENYCYQRFLNYQEGTPTERRDELLTDIQQRWPEMETDEIFNSPQGGKLPLFEAIETLKALTILNPVQRAQRWLLNTPQLAQSTLHTGAFNATQDNDGSIRRSRLFVRTGNTIQPSLAFKAFLVSRNLNATINFRENPFARKSNIDSKIVQDVDIFDEEGNSILKVPTDIEGRVPLNYAGPQKMFAYLSASELLDDDDEMIVEQRIFNEKFGRWTEEEIKADRKEWVKGKNFIFGATATGIYDLRVTPFEEDYPGVETHANMLDNLLRGDFLKTSKIEGRYMPWIIGGIGMIFSTIIAQFGAVFGLIIALLMGLAIILIDFFYIFKQNTVINIFFPLFLISFLYVFLTFFKYFTEERKKKQLKGTFEKYVSPAIVNEILKDPSKLELGGTKQEMTVFFSDVRGFTTISERLDPRALSDLLNNYLTPMTEIIFANNGTLDKYMGDAIMAFFGAPIVSKKHAAQACRASLLQLTKLFELQKVWESQGLPSIDIGIGLNTGDMSVGNMGSQTVRNYTVMGDAVNLGSRLEGINKQYGTRIIISEFTQAHIASDNFITREIDWVRVKGKTEPVRIFELIQEGDPDQALAQRIKHFNSGFALYHQRAFAKAINEFNAALDLKADDQCSRLYIDRCKDYLDNPPEDKWDGVFVMKTK